MEGRIVVGFPPAAGPDFSMSAVPWATEDVGPSRFGGERERTVASGAVGSGSQAPWATHYPSPGEAPQGVANVRSASGVRRDSDRDRGSANDSIRGDRRVHHVAARGVSFGDERAALGAAFRTESDDGWKRPSTLAPPWVAGGGQEMLLSSPAQGRKVSFVLSRPAYYNVEDAPSAVPSRKSDRHWRHADDGYWRPQTPAAAPVLRPPVTSMARPPTPASPSAHGPNGRPSWAIEEGPARLRPQTPGALAAALPEDARASIASDIKPMQSTEWAQTNGLRHSPRAVSSHSQDGAGGVYPGHGGVVAKTAQGDTTPTLFAAGVQDPWSSARKTVGKDREKHTVGTQRPVSARSRAKDYGKAVTESNMTPTRRGMGSGGGASGTMAQVKLGPDRAAERVALQKKAQEVEAAAVQGRAAGGAASAGASGPSLSPRSRAAKTRQWDAERRQVLYGGAPAAKAKALKDMEARKSLLAMAANSDLTSAAAESQVAAAMADEQAALGRVGAHRAGGPGVNHDDRPVAAHRCASTSTQAPGPPPVGHALHALSLPEHNQSRDAVAVATKANTQMKIEEQAHALQRQEEEEAEDLARLRAEAFALQSVQHAPPPPQPSPPSMQPPHQLAPPKSSSANPVDVLQTSCGDGMTESGPVEETAVDDLDHEAPPQDDKEAFVWYRARAGLGDVDAMFNLGVCYEEGRGVRQDGKMAFAWYQRAASRGDSDALFSLGVCFHDGIGTPTDETRAMHLWEQAANQGNADAAFILHGMRVQSSGLSQAFGDEGVGEGAHALSVAGQVRQGAAAPASKSEEEEEALLHYVHRKEQPIFPLPPAKQQATPDGLCTAEDVSAESGAQVAFARDEKQDAAERLSPVSRVLRGESLEQVARDVVQARMLQDPSAHERKLHAQHSRKEPRSTHGHLQRLDAGLGSVLVAGALLAAGDNALEKSLASDSRMIPAAATGIFDLFAGGAEEIATADEGARVSVMVPDALSEMSTSQLAQSLSAETQSLFSQAAAHGLTGYKPRLDQDPARPPPPNGRYLSEDNEMDELTEVDGRRSGSAEEDVTVDGAHNLQGLQRKVHNMQELQRKVQDLRAQAASHEAVLRKSLASLTSLEGAPENDPAELDAGNDDDVYESEQSPGVPGRGVSPREGRLAAAAGVAFHGRGAVDEAGGPLTTMSMTTTTAKTAALVDAASVMWAELKARQTVEDDGMGANECAQEPATRHVDAPGAAQDSVTPVAHDSVGHEAPGAAQDPVTTPSSLDSSFRSSSGAKSRGGRLGLLSVSLDASDDLQLPDTPLGCMPSDAGCGEIQSGAVDKVAPAALPTDSAGHALLSASDASREVSQDSNFGGHMGKLQASLTRSADLQLPPTPTPLAHDSIGHEADCAHSTMRVKLPSGGDGSVANRGCREALDRAPQEVGAHKGKHGRLAMLSDSLDMSQALQLPPTPDASIAMESGREVEVKHTTATSMPTVAAAYGQNTAAGFAAYLQAVIENNDSKKTTECFKLVVKYFQNVVRAPHEEKYRRIPKDNKAFKSRVAACHSSSALLAAAGWRDCNGSWQLPGDFNRPQLSLALDTISDTLALQSSGLLPRPPDVHAAGMPAVDMLSAVDSGISRSASGPLGRARQVLDLRRSLQKLDLAERELECAFVGAVVSSALPLRPDVGQMHGDVDQVEEANSFREMIVSDVATGDLSHVQEEVDEIIESSGDSVEKQDMGNDAALSHRPRRIDLADTAAAAAANQTVPEQDDNAVRHLRKTANIAVIVDSASRAPSRQSDLDTPCLSSGNHRSDNHLTPTEREEQGLGILLDALTPKKRTFRSPKKQAPARSSVGFRRSMRTSLSIQLGLVAATPTVGALGSSSGKVGSGNSSSSFFRGLGTLQSPGTVTGGSGSQGVTPHEATSGSRPASLTPARVDPASQRDHLNDSDVCLFSSIAQRGVTGGQMVAAQVAVARAAGAAATAEEQDLPGARAGAVVAWEKAEVLGAEGSVEVLEGSLSLQRARRQWATLSRDHQLSLTRGLFAGELLTSSASACAEVAEGDDEEMDLIYDPNLGLYFDPKSNSFFMRE